MQALHTSVTSFQGCVHAMLCLMLPSGWQPRSAAPAAEAPAGGSGRGAAAAGVTAAFLMAEAPGGAGSSGEAAPLLESLLLQELMARFEAAGLQMVAPSFSLTGGHPCTRAGCLPPRALLVARGSCALPAALP
jgi:hypothetical protein